MYCLPRIENEPSSFSSLTNDPNPASSMVSPPMSPTNPSSTMFPFASSIVTLPPSSIVSKPRVIPLGSFTTACCPSSSVIVGVGASSTVGAPGTGVTPSTGVGFTLGATSDPIGVSRGLRPFTMSLI